MSYKMQFRGVAALLAWFFLILQYGLMVTSGEHSGIVAASFAFFSYFTIWGNILVALALTAPLLPQHNSLREFFDIPATRSATALYICVIMVVYHAMLAQLRDLQGLDLIADIGLHSLMPILYMFDWTFFAKKTPNRLQSIPYWLIFPLLFGVVTLVRGDITGTYPYPFLDVATLGFDKVLMNMGVFLGLYAVGAVVFIILGNILSQYIPES